MSGTSGIGRVDGGFLRWVFGIDTVTGALITTLNNPDPTASDLFGVSVAVAGNIAVIGASADHPGGVGNAGTAYVFDTLTGALTATLNNPDPTANDEFGTNVAVAGTTNMN